jgi:diaminopimelate decarboxylase
MFGRDPQGTATVGGLAVDQILAGAGCGTPAYLYDLDAIRAAGRGLLASFAGVPHLVAYAAKANSAGPILRALFDVGCGADVVSGGELALVLETGLSPENIVFSGVAKRDDEIDRAISSGPAGIYALQAESVEEIGRIAARARTLGKRARLSIRVNPGVSIDTHAHVATGHDEAKFGILAGDLGDAYRVIDARSELHLTGLSSHIGSTQTSTRPYLAAARVLFDVVKAREAARGPLAFVDAGGGFGIDYGQGCPVEPADFVRGLLASQKEAGLSHLRLVVEPGRSLVGPFGVLVATVIQTKSSASSGRRWLMIDAGMNDLLRPALYQARHRIEALSEAPGTLTASFRVVGPICESADDFGAYDLASDPPPSAVVIRDSGAYGFTMASTYNGRSLPAEIFVSNGRVASVSPASSTSAWIAGRIQP